MLQHYKYVYISGIDLAPFLRARFIDNYNYSKPFKLTVNVIRNEFSTNLTRITTDKMILNFVDEINWRHELETNVFSFQNLYLNVSKQTLHYVDIIKGSYVLRDAIKTNSDYNPLKGIRNGCIDYLHFEPTELDNILKNRVNYMLNELEWITLPEIEEKLRS